MEEKGSISVGNSGGSNGGTRPMTEHGRRRWRRLRQTISINNVGGRYCTERAIFRNVFYS